MHRQEKYRTRGPGAKATVCLSMNIHSHFLDSYTPLLLHREAALEEYRTRGPGAEKAKLLLENRAKLKEQKRKAKVG